MESRASQIRSASDILAERKRKRAAASQPAPQGGLAAKTLSPTSYGSLSEHRRALSGAVTARSLKEVKDARRSDAARYAEESAIYLQREQRATPPENTRGGRDRREHGRSSRTEGAQGSRAWAADGWSHGDGRSQLGEAPPRDTLTSPIAKDAAIAHGPALERKQTQSLTLTTKRAAEAERPPIVYERNVVPRAFESSTVSATAVQVAARAAARGERVGDARPTPYIECLK